MKTTCKTDSVRRVLAFALAFWLAHPGTVSASENDGNFTLRRVAPPAEGAARRITVQIEIDRELDSASSQATSSQETQEESASDEADILQPSISARSSWSDVNVNEFWTRLSPERGPGRLMQAAMLLPLSQAAADPRQHDGIRRIALEHGAAVSRATYGKRISPALVLAVILTESSGRSDAVSSAGAAGLMQLMPATAERFEVPDRFDPHENIRGGVTYLDWLLKEFDGDALLALAGYNAGENAVRRYRGVPPYAETLAYIPKVVDAWRAASGLCTTPQQTATDRCEFNLIASAAP